MEQAPNPGQPPQYGQPNPNMPPPQYGQPNPNMPPPQYGQPGPNMPPPQYGQPVPGPQGQYSYQPGPQYGQPIAPGSSGMSPALAVVLAYLLGIIGPIIVLAVEKQNNFVRFHALQALLAHAALFAAGIVLFFLGTFLAIVHLGFISFILGVCLEPLAFLGAGVFLLVVLIQAAQGKTMRVPLIADYADRLLPTFMR